MEATTGEGSGFCYVHFRCYTDYCQECFAGTSYIPQSGSEEIEFQNAWCCRCQFYNVSGAGLPDPDCPIIARAYRDNWADEWIYGADGLPKCTAFQLVIPELTESQRMRQAGQPKLFGKVPE